MIHIDTKAGAPVTEKRLRNGMQVIFIERHDAPVVTTLLYYKVGARNEAMHETGVSHFLEHMMFKGSQRYGKGQIDLITTTLGGTNNAWTSHDHTAYWFEFASDRWERALELESDRMRGLMLSPDEFEAEKAVVLEELSMGEDDPWRELGREVGEALFAGHPYGRPVIGYEDVLRDMDVDLMRGYYDRFYRPENAVLVICGDMRPASAMKLVRKHFAPLGNAPAGVASAVFQRAPAEPRAEKRITCRWDDDARRLYMAWPTVTVGTDEDYALDLVTVIMATGRRSRLYQRLVQDEGMAMNISMSNDTRREGGAMWLMSECSADTRPADLEAAIDEELQRLATELVPAKELKRARDMLHAAAAHECETVTDLAESIGSFAVDAQWRLALEADERLAAIRPKFLRDTVARLLEKRRRVVGWSLPRDMDVAETAS
ncbi:MAG: zinc protease [Candidatus Paceibacteria bacterium]